MATKAAMANKRIDIADVFDKLPFTGYQIGICILCLCVMTLDGFDNLIIGVAAPRIAQALKLSPQSLGVIFMAAHFGFMVGALGIGTLADRVGRKRMLIVSALIFGIVSLITTQVSTLEQLTICRFISGIGLGGAVPNSVAFGSEYAPSRLRASLATLMWLGMPTGGVLAGFAAAYLIPVYGWQRLFWIGGIAPLVFIIVVVLALPESLAFLVRQGKDTKQIRKIVSRISPTLVSGNQEVEFFSSDKKLPGVPVKHLFSDGRSVTTVLLWALFFLSFLLIQFMMSWNPTLLRRSGATVQQYSLAFSLVNFGCMLATIGIGPLMDRFNRYRLLMVTFVLSAGAIAAFGILAHLPFTFVAVVAVFTGIFIAAGNSGLMALAAMSYPVSIRGTGIGWAYAMARLGAMSGPLLGGILLARNWSTGAICSIIGISGLLAAIAVMMLKQHAQSAAAVRPEVAKTAAATP